jgi:hypothetical protein
LRTTVESIRAAGRSTLGVRVISLNADDTLAALARLEAPSGENNKEHAFTLDETAEPVIEEAIGIDEAGLDEAEDEIPGDDTPTDAATDVGEDVEPVTAD